MLKISPISRLLFLPITLIFLIFSFVPTMAQVKAIEAPFLTLKGDHKFRLGDNLSWADPGYDDGDWQVVPVPSLWSELNVPKDQPVGWYRIRFSFSDKFQSDQPAFVSYVLHQEEVYLNGQKIGGYGQFGIYGKTPRPDVPYGRFRVYEIPKELLRLDQENILAIRLNRVPQIQEGGIAHYAFGLADYHKAIAARAKVRKVHWIVDGTLFGMNALLSTFMLVLLAFGIRNRLTISFTLTIVTLTLNNLGESHFVFDAGIFSPALREARNAMIAITLVSVLEFISALLKVRLGWFGRGVQALLLLSFFPYYQVFGSLDDSVIQITLQMVIAALLGYAIVVFATCGWAIWKGNRIGWIVLLAFALTSSLPGVINLLSPDTLLELGYILGRWPNNVSSQIFFLALTALAAHQLYTIEIERARANERALQAQANERQRVARDLHDNLSQWLGAFKIRLQKLQSETKSDPEFADETLHDFLDEMDSLIDETRRISHDLSPIAVAFHGLESMVNDYLTSLQDDQGVGYELNIDPSFSPRNDVADHLYRIVQEAAQNAIKHGGATKLEITLQKDDAGRPVLSIKDNGKGFDPDATSGEFSLGLQSIRERAGIVDANLSIKSTKDTGTQIEIRSKMSWSSWT